MTAKEWMLGALAVFAAVLAANLVTAYVVAEQAQSRMAGTPLARLLGGA